MARLTMIAAAAAAAVIGAAQGDENPNYYNGPLLPGWNPSEEWHPPADWRPYSFLPPPSEMEGGAPGDNWFERWLAHHVYGHGGNGTEPSGPSGTTGSTGGGMPTGTTGSTGGGMPTGTTGSTGGEMPPPPTDGSGGTPPPPTDGSGGTPPPPTMPMSGTFTWNSSDPDSSGGSGSSGGNGGGGEPGQPYFYCHGVDARFNSQWGRIEDGNATSYAPNSQCVWYLPKVPGKGIHLWLAGYAIEPSERCQFDSLTVLAVKDHGDVDLPFRTPFMCGSFSGGAAARVDDHVIVAFRSDYSGQEWGFEISYSYSDLPTCANLYTVMDRCRRQRGGYTPGMGSSYEPMNDWSWTCDDMMLNQGMPECPSGMIFNGEYCETACPDTAAWGQIMGVPAV